MQVDGESALQTGSAGDENHCGVAYQKWTIIRALSRYPPSRKVKCHTVLTPRRIPMTTAEKKDRGLLRTNQEECKGCGLCIEACPPRVISLSERLNPYGYRTAVYAGHGCTGCGICFLACPEPGAITVYRRNAQVQRITAEAVCASS